MNEVSASDDGDEIFEVNYSDKGVVETQYSDDEKPLIEARDV